ncbi:hypothetical protein HEQ75_23475 [Roseomonas sp. BU-1]|uniref:RNA methyltransferase n=1 Tax=Falsiroseomonas selenitidurans TaxID=2716335 RepID=A0ABX1E9I2_9PROT|nr:hypothetical protein [Falsiroseomonas selenitidurans]
MATYAQISTWVASNAGFSPKTCWIAHVKSDFGLITQSAPNRADPTRRAYPCPPNKRPAIEAALRHFSMI